MFFLKYFEYIDSLEIHCIHKTVFRHYSLWQPSLISVFFRIEGTIILVMKYCFRPSYLNPSYHTFLSTQLSGQQF